MSSDKTPWSQMVVGERVVGRGGLVWTIAGKDDDPATGLTTIALERDGQRRDIHVKPGDGIVVAPLADDLDTARNIMAVHTAPDGDFETFPDATRYGPASLLAHLKIVHGKDVSAITKPFIAHIEAHAAGESARPHEHSARAAQRGKTA